MTWNFGNKWPKISFLNSFILIWYHSTQSHPKSEWVTEFTNFLYRVAREKRKEMKLLLDMYKGVSKETRDKVEVWKTTSIGFQIKCFSFWTFFFLNLYIFRLILLSDLLNIFEEMTYQVSSFERSCMCDIALDIALVCSCIAHIQFKPEENWWSLLFKCL